MDIALGVSMTPTAVRMVLVEGEKADGVTVDHDAFDIASGDSSATAPAQVMAAILGTRESATEGGHRLVATGVTWRDHDDAARLKEALAARHIDDVLLVSELHAAGMLAQAAGRAMGYERTALMFLDGDAATLSVVESADGSVVRVERQDLHSDDAVAQLTAMVGALEHLDAAPQGVFVVGSGVSAAALKPQLETATSLPVHAPDEPGLALARGAALASAGAPMFEASTIEQAYAHDGDEGPTAGSALAYSEVVDEEPLALLADAAEPEPELESELAAPAKRKPLLLVGSAMTGLFVLGVAALVVSLAVSIRPTVDQRPSPAESVIVPTQTPAPIAAVPAATAPPAAPPETIQAPIPVVQEAPAPAPQAPPRTVFVEAPAPAPAPAAPAPAPAPAAPAPAPAAPAPVAQAPVVAPPVVAPAPIVVPRLPFIQWPWQRQTTPQQQYPQQYPQQQYPQQYPQQQQEPEWYPPAQQQQPQWYPPVQQQKPQPQWDPPKQQWPGSGRGSDGDGSGSRGSGKGGNSGNGGNSQWPWPSWGNGWDN